MSVSAILLAAKGDVKKAKLKFNEGDELDTECIQTYFRKKTVPVQLGYYEYDNYLLFLLGYKEGKAGTENKHEMPPPYDTLIAFGDMLLIASHERDWRRPVSFTPEQYQKFYDSMFGGFDSTGEDTDVSEDEVDDDDDDDADDADDAGEADDEDAIEVLEEEPDEPEEPVLQKKKAAAVKKVAASSGYQKQQQLLLQTNFTELDATDTSEQKQRQIALKRFQYLGESGFTAEEIKAFEVAIYESSCKQADRLKVIKHWDNPLFNDIYTTTQRTLMANLHDKSPIKNTRLMMRLKDKELSLTDLPFMSSYEMYPEHWKELADRQMLREQKLLEGNKGAATDRFKCNRCGKRECSYYEMQTRSADEPMTIFINCLNCGKRWRQ